MKPAGAASMGYLSPFCLLSALVNFLSIGVKCVEVGNESQGQSVEQGNIEHFNFG